MFKTDVREYKQVFKVNGWTIWEHSESFHYVLTRYMQRHEGSRDVSVMCWTMPGLASDEPVMFPAGFVRDLIKNFAIEPFWAPAPPLRIRANPVNRLAVPPEPVEPPPPPQAQGNPHAYVQYDRFQWEPVRAHPMDEDF